MWFEYLLLLGLCLLITLTLEFVFGARVYRRPRRLLLTVAAVVVVFGAWDLVGIHREHWWYASEKISGIYLPLSLPLEEFLFFVVIPICGILTFETVRVLLGKFRTRTGGDTRA